MLRLLFTTEDNVHQMTVVTDGIDGQMKVFVTESLYGDVEYYKGLGIVIEPGHTYNIGQFKEWAFKALVKLISYPEGFGEEGAVLSDVQEVVEYVLETKEPTLNFPAKGGDDMCVVTSSKQTFKNGQPVGHPEGVPVEFSISGAGFKVDGGGQVTVDYTTVVSGTGFTKGSTEYSVVADVNTGAQRTGTAVVTAVEGDKKATVNLTQLAGA